MESETRYAKSGDVYIAYRVFGEGPRDIILIPGTVSHVEQYWELPANQHMLKRLSSFARVIVFDKRGQGLSDRIAEHGLRDFRIGLAPEAGIEDRERDVLESFDGGVTLAERCHGCLIHRVGSGANQGRETEINSQAGIDVAVQLAVQIMSALAIAGRSAIAGIRSGR